MEKFKKLGRDEMKKVLGGDDEMGHAGDGCSAECKVDTDCPGAQLCKDVGCPSGSVYKICY